MTDKNYYEILGLSDSDKNLPEKEFQEKLKKNFRDLSLIWHPDRWVGKSEKEQKEAEDKFKEIAEAYNVLSDPQKKKEYDNPNNGFEGFPFPFGFNPFNMGNQKRVNVGASSYVKVGITIQEAYKGVKKTIEYKYRCHCPDCHGTGSEDGVEHVCPHCKGSGFIGAQTNNGFQSSVEFVTCPYCSGTGKIITKPCKKCKGSGLIEKTGTITIDVPAGVFDGARMKFDGIGCEPKGEGKRGNLIVEFSIKTDDYFHYGNNPFDLVHEEKIHFNEALLGCEREIKFIDGTTKKLKIPEGTQDNSYFTYNNKGMFNIQEGNGYGNYYVVIKYEYPQKLNKEQKKLLGEFKW